MTNFKVVLVAALIFTTCTKKPQYVHLPMLYPDAAKSAFESFEKQSQYVTMSDGVKIAVDIFIPTKGNNQKQFPVILSYTPYQRATINRETGKISSCSTSP